MDPVHARCKARRTNPPDVGRTGSRVPPRLADARPMVFGLHRGDARDIVLEPLPCREEAWFRALPPDRRATMEHEHELRQLREFELLRRERAMPWREAPLFAGTWAVADLACRQANAASVLGALVLGGALGWASVRFDAGVNTTVAVGLATFMAFEYLAGGSWSVPHLLTFPGVGAVTYFVANRREDRFVA